MKIAVSGSHCTGKSTLIERFISVHPEFIHEPEPYAVLVEELGEEFCAEPSVEDLLRQLEFNIQRLQQYERGANVIYERCPIDFLAYIECLSHTQSEDLVEQVSEAIQSLDLIVYLPLNSSIEVDEDEFPLLRKAVGRRLSDLYGENEFGVTVIEATGPTDRRLKILKEAIKAASPP